MRPLDNGRTQSPAIFPREVELSAPGLVNTQSSSVPLILVIIRLETSHTGDFDVVENDRNDWRGWQE